MVIRIIGLHHVPLIVIDHKAESISQFQFDQFRNTDRRFRFV